MGADPTGSDSVTFSVTFSEAVTGSTGLRSGVDVADFVLDQSGTKAVTGAFVTGVRGSGDTYTVIVDSGTGNGSLSVDLSDDDSIVDLAGNPLGGVGVGNGDFTAGEAFTVDKTDTDGDGVPDLVEITVGTDPLTVPSMPLSAWLLFGVLVPLGVWALRRG